MITTAKNKNELIAGLKQQKDFAVLATHTGPAVAVAKEIAKYDSIKSAYPASDPYVGKLACSHTLRHRSLLISTDLLG